MIGSTKYVEIGELPEASVSKPTLIHHDFKNTTKNQKIAENIIWNEVASE